MTEACELRMPSLLQSSGIESDFCQARIKSSLLTYFPEMIM